MSWFILAVKKYATFSGRSSRSEYWYFWLFFFLFLFAAGVVDGILGGMRTASSMGVAAAVVALALLVPAFAVAARRLHDIGKSGWWQLISFIPIAGPILLLVWFVKDSEPGANAYGPNPKGGSEIQRITRAAG